VLVIAGALVELSTAAVAVAVGYVLLRACGKLAAGRVLPLLAASAPAGAAHALVTPGLLAVAFALAARRALGDELALALSVAVLGTIGAQLLAGAGPDEGGR
jgi:hypothetical protein